VKKSFEQELCELVNKHSLENLCDNTPDFILAQYLCGVLNVFKNSVYDREKWYGKFNSPGDSNVIKEETHCPRCGEERSYSEDQCMNPKCESNKPCPYCESLGHPCIRHVPKEPNKMEELREFIKSEIDKSTNYDLKIYYNAVLSKLDELGL